MNQEEILNHIIQWYFADTIELLDMVLDDDPDDPQYSAITTLNRLWVYQQYQNKADKDHPCRDISSLLEKLGYSSEDVALFQKKAREEYKIYAADIFGPDFLFT